MGNNAKDSLKLILNQLSPKLYIKFLKSRYFITNNMNIYLLNSYDPAGTFVTMWDTPPEYYQRWKASLHYNEEGIPLHTPNGENKASAVPIVQFGLCEYGYYIHTKDKEHLELAKKIADWLTLHQAENGGWLYEYDLDHKPTGQTIQGPWICAMAQGEGAGFLGRMYHLLGEEKYRESAEMALTPLEKQVEDGGVRRNWNGNIFYEEYPTPSPSLTINGFMFCLVGIYDYAALCNSQRGFELFEEGYNSLLRMLPYYDSENTTYYDLSHITCPPRKPVLAGKYDPIHVMLVQMLNLIKPHPVLRFYTEKWSWGILKEKELPTKL